MLRRELENPLTKSAPAELQAVAARLEQLTQEGAESAQLNQSVERWLQGHKPAWFDFAEPKSLDDPRLANLDALENPAQFFSGAEMVKLDLLIAASPAQPSPRRQRAYLDALERLIDFSFTQEEARRVSEPILDDVAFPEWLRVEVLWQAIFNARLEERAADFEKLIAHPLFAKFNDRTKTSAEIFHEALKCDSSSPQALGEFCSRILSREITAATLRELRIAFARLLELG